MSPETNYELKMNELITANKGASPVECWFSVQPFERTRKCNPSDIPAIPFTANTIWFSNIRVVAKTWHRIYQRVHPLKNNNCSPSAYALVTKLASLYDKYASFKPERRQACSSSSFPLPRELSRKQLRHSCIKPR